MTPPAPASDRQVPAPAGRVVVGVSALLADRRASEHLLVRLVGASGASGSDVLACTHLVSSPWRHEAVSLEVPATDPATVLRVARAVAPGAAIVVLDDGGQVREVAGDALDGAREAMVRHATRQGGRAVVFQGQDVLVGDVAVTDVLARTQVDAVLSSHGAYAADAVLVTGGFVRPVFRDGRIVVLVGHDDPTRLMPWELPNPTACCADH